MNNLEIYFKEISENQSTEEIQTRVIYEKYGVKRKGWKVVEKVNDFLDKYELQMTPSFDIANIYHSVTIEPKPTIPENGEIKNPKYFDPIPRINIVKSSDLKNNLNIELISVSKETPIQEAVSIMLKYDFSQLPILSSVREAYGLISWKTIGTALSLKKECKTVSDCFTTVDVLDYDEPLFDAVKIVLNKEVVLVRNNAKEISGIITPTDVGEQFLNLSEPFLLIEQIENMIRILLKDKLTFDDIKTVLDFDKMDKKINHLSDMSFGHYVKIIENSKLYKKIKINVDRSILVNMLTETNKIRNEVMHFSPEEMEQDDLKTLRQTLHFLKEIV